MGKFWQNAGIRIQNFWGKKRETLPPVKVIICTSSKSVCATLYEWSPFNKGRKLKSSTDIQQHTGRLDLGICVGINSEVCLLAKQRHV